MSGWAIGGQAYQCWRCGAGGAEFVGPPWIGRTLCRTCAMAEAQERETARLALVAAEDRERASMWGCEVEGV